MLNEAMFLSVLRGVGSYFQLNIFNVFGTHLNVLFHFYGLMKVRFASFFSNKPLSQLSQNVKKRHCTR